MQFVIDREEASLKFFETFRYVCSWCKFASGDPRIAKEHEGREQRAWAREKARGERMES